MDEKRVTGLPEPSVEVTCRRWRFDIGFLPSIWFICSIVKEDPVIPQSFGRLEKRIFRLPERVVSGHLPHAQSFQN